MTLTFEHVSTPDVDLLRACAPDGTEYTVSDIAGWVLLAHKDDAEVLRETYPSLWAALQAAQQHQSHHYYRHWVAVGSQRLHVFGRSREKRVNGSVVTEVRARCGHLMERPATDTDELEPCSRCNAKEPPPR